MIGKSEYGVPAALDFVDRLRDDIVPAAGFPGGVAVYAGGGPPGGRDFLDLTYGAFPWLVLGVLAAHLLPARCARSGRCCCRSRRSSSTCSRSAPPTACSPSSSSGAAARRVGLIAFDQIEGWIPVFIFAMVFGLSMDYEVFLVARMREEWDEGGDNE